MSGFCSAHKHHEPGCKQCEMEKPHCPICGSETYEKKSKSNGILGPGGYSVKLYCICSGCSVMFKDPERFFRG